MELLTPEVITAGLGGVATYGLVAYAERGNKRKNPWATPPASPRANKKTRFVVPARRATMARFKSGRRFRRRTKRRFNRRTRRVVRKRRTVFKRRVKSVILRTLETFKKHYTETSFSLAPGNGTTGMNIRVFAPWQSAFTQGDGSGGMTGSKVYIWKFVWSMFIRGLIAGDVQVQIIFFKSDFQMDVTNAGADTNNEGTTMTPSTTSVLVPTQVAPNGNIPIFDVTASPGQFAGLSPVTPYNNDNIKILKIWNYKLPGFGVATTDPFVKTSLSFPFNKAVQIQETQETIDGVPRFFGQGGRRAGSDQYYIAVRTFGQDVISSSSAITVTHSGKLFYKDI